MVRCICSGLEHVEVKFLNLVLERSCRHHLRKTALVFAIENCPTFVVDCLIEQAVSANTSSGSPYSKPGIL